MIVREECSCCSRLAPTLATHLSVGTLHAVESQERMRPQWCAGSLGVGLAPGNTQMCKSSLKVVYNMLTSVVSSGGIPRHIGMHDTWKYLHTTPTELLAFTCV